jgi:hypothetical protein
MGRKKKQLINSILTWTITLYILQYIYIVYTMILERNVAFQQCRKGGDETFQNIMYYITMPSRDYSSGAGTVAVANDKIQVHDCILS